MNKYLGYNRKPPKLSVIQKYQKKKKKKHTTCMKKSQLTDANTEMEQMF